MSTLDFNNFCCELYTSLVQDGIACGIDFNGDMCKIYLKADGKERCYALLRGDAGDKRVEDVAKSVLEYLHGGSS